MKPTIIKKDGALLILPLNTEKEALFIIFRVEGKDVLTVDIGIL